MNTGMNFAGSFYALQFGDSFFWYIAVPVGITTTLLLLRDSIARWYLKVKQRRHIALTRKRRRNAAGAKEKKP